MGKKRKARRAAEKLAVLRAADDAAFHAEPFTLTIPYSRGAILEGSKLTIAQRGSGQIAVEPGPGVCLTVAWGGRPATRSQHSLMELHRIKSPDPDDRRDHWVLMGDVAPPTTEEP
jgi:hypothetical protein